LSLTGFVFCGAALTEIDAIDRQQTGRWLNNRPGIHTCHFDDENKPCFNFGGCEVYKKLPPFILPCAITLTGNAASQVDRTSTLTAPPLLPSGAYFERD
jgi:hypothetical protein